jgi:hypothetical protein
MLNLPDVTLLLAGSHTRELSAMAIKSCLKSAYFGDILVFSDEEILPGKTIHVPQMNSVLDWAHFVWYDVAKFVITSHVLMIHWDSWIINEGMWTPDFLRYDYIGAPWTWERHKYRVGNSGFSLRSKKMMDLIASNPERYVCGLPEDQRMCRLYREELESEGIVFAPEDMAARFSYERDKDWHGSTQVWPGDNQFGFHGIFNFPFVLSEANLKTRMDMAKADPKIASRGFR